MLIQIEIPDDLPEGRRSSFKKGIVEALHELATTRSELEHTPEGHELYKEKGRAVGRALGEKIQEAYPK